LRPTGTSGYQGARGSVRTPFKRARFRPQLSYRQKAVNRAHAKICARGERAIAALKTWKILVNCAAAHAEPPRSSKPSSSCTCQNQPPHRMKTAQYSL